MSYKQNLGNTTPLNVDSSKITCIASLIITDKFIYNNLNRSMMVNNKLFSFILGIICLLCLFLLFPYKPYKSQDYISLRNKVKTILASYNKVEVREIQTTTTTAALTIERKVREKYRFYNDRNTKYPDVDDILKKWLERKEVTCLIDIGANVGRMATLAASKGKKVIAVEPLPKNLALLNKLIQDNNWTELVHVFPYAMSNENKTLRMTNEVPKRFDTAYVIDKNDKPGIPSLDGTFEVEAVTLNALISKAKTCGNPILKIDVQGHECFVFKEGSEFFKQIDLPYFAMEWILANRVDPECNRDMIKTLKSVGYKAFYMDDVTEIPENILMKSVETPNRDLYNMIWKKQ